ncbi:hypothetical protein pEaSNUABM50_00341 [Erwinia phage pEa_SNUABM_50]|uniref:Uncharacterized protein n=4 Tax=Eneladusvirus BF TaxID=2560751 RepID=A0A7L8ZMW1_9CAUD|nr:hypothetical protein FDH34_gp345 [Serratia phage BF]QOI71282.1 hypothetical protein pEaSNUABM12_00344 [Erwinia phage pEa_SNUABM_12]QOI71826.1 hypothetical protein pEaSNUABM47_00342 [Erwinia phage pEa_SNUABM_47]QOI72365.1 hypothetical protein pEaSNUABM50_00341 [Erwinia phage pEa_SNUABM_50]QXO11491.1 hypothetical protein pEaSNUABM19_00345 [Erwinia phage pEa_SNUABM_19]QXO12039.1 hypothetical protein pEaSNUABM44_00343 [Erwinia phage pEa_SNUABM_44]QXO12592.1 hypothetical protein pEaSNUABM49_003
MFTIILTLVLTNQSSSSVTYGSFDDIDKCKTAISEVKKEYIGSSVREVIGRCARAK